MKHPVCIIGAGPGGCGTALQLNKLGIPSILFDKSSFPRDKICGDALSGKLTMLLNRHDPRLLSGLATTFSSRPVWGIRFVAPSGKGFDLPFASHSGDYAPGYTCTRKSFDNYLVSQLAKAPLVDIRTNSKVCEYTKVAGGFHLTTSHNETFFTPIVIDASGANSTFSSQVAGLRRLPKHYAAGLRQYYRNVGNRHPEGFIELHFLKELLPGYFWIFPLGDDLFNVGLGVRSDIIRKKSLSIKKIFGEIIAHHPRFKDRFENAIPQERIQGFGLPLGSSKRTISGDHFLLVGDAAHLIDPLTGEGIGNAYYSGVIAADQVSDSIVSQRWDADFLKAYDHRIERVLGQEMKLSYRLQQLVRHPWIANFLGNTIHHNQTLIRTMTDMYTDLDARQQLINPWFWIKYALKKK